LGHQKDQDLERLAPFLDALRRAHPDAKVILFGSRARGDHLKTSDYDLLVLSRDFEGVPFRERILGVCNLLDPTVSADIICLTHREFRTRSKELSVIGTAAKEGIHL